MNLWCARGTCQFSQENVSSVAGLLYDDKISGDDKSFTVSCRAGRDFREGEKISFREGVKTGFGDGASLPDKRDIELVGKEAEPLLAINAQMELPREVSLRATLKQYREGANTKLVFWAWAHTP